MRKRTVAQAPTDPQGPIRLTDLTVTWTEGKREHQVTGEQLALALDHAWARTHAGRDDWQQCLADIASALTQLKNAERLLSDLATLNHKEIRLSPQAFAAIEETMTNARIKTEAVFHRERRSEYRVQINPASARKG